MSGHSKWSTIKRQKGVADNKRGQLFTKLAREITVAARTGLPDPDSNFRLRIAVEKARKENMPKDNIDRAIERAKGTGGGDNYDEITYEGFGPGGVAFMIAAMTDNRNRTVSEVRAAMTRGGGNLGADGSVGWMFDSVGMIVVNWESFLGRYLDRLPERPPCARVFVRTPRGLTRYHASFDATPEETRTLNSFTEAERRRRPGFVRRQLTRANVWPEDEI